MLELKLANLRGTENVAGSAPAAIPNPAPARFIGRQPILNTELKLYGHELLYRSGAGNFFSGDEEHATQSVIDDWLLLMPEGNNEVSFVNCTRQSLLSGIVTLLPPSNTVLEILENVGHDAELLSCCVELKKAGYRFALDDFSPDAATQPFIAIADYIKVDFMAADAAVRRTIYATAAGYKIKFVAEKVETEADLRTALAEGCELFQGYFFCKPQMVATRVIPHNQLVYLRLLGALTRTPANLSEIETLVMSEASVCYRLLRLVNSALYALPSPITSIRGALMMVGDDEFRKVVTVALANVAATSPSQAVIQLALERAKFCELLAPLMNEPAPMLYLLGMLSLIDVILGMPMKQIMDLLPLDPRMKAACLGEQSSLTIALELVRCHESGDWTTCHDLQETLGLAEPTGSKIYVQAVQWANTVNRATAA